jgi:hypothetical protein
MCSYEEFADMPEDRDQQLESLFAAEEAAIMDDGFTQGVMTGTRKTPYLRRVALYGAGMAGFGVAAGSLSELMSRYPMFLAWVEKAQASIVSADVQSAWAVGSASPVLTVAVILGVTLSLAALAFQNR